MTTITYKNGIIAFDSLIVFGNLIIGECEDKVRAFDIFIGDTKEQWLVGVSGDAESCEALFDWGSSNFDSSLKPTMPVGEEAILDAFIIKPNGIWRVDSNLKPYKILNDFDALGSGSQIALGAMAYGATAKEALKIASKYDINTGGKLRHLSLRKGKK